MWVRILPRVLVGEDEEDIMSHDEAGELDFHTLIAAGRPPV